MGIGLGILLIVIGAILLFALNVNLPFFSDDTLGMILIGAGVLMIILVLVLNSQRRRTRVVQANPPVVREDRYDPPVV